MMIFIGHPRSFIDAYCVELAKRDGPPQRPSDYNIRSIVDRIVSEGAVEDMRPCVPRWPE